MNVRTSVQPRLPIPRVRPAGGLLPSASLSDLAEIVWRRRWSILAITLLSIVLTLGYLQLIRGDLYMAEAKLLVRMGQEQAPSPTMIDHSMLVGAQNGYAAPEVEMLASRDLIGKLVDSIDLTGKPAPPPTSLYGMVKYYGKALWRTIKGDWDEALIWAGLKPRLTDREQTIEAIATSLVVDSPPNSNIFTARLFWPERGVPKVLLAKLLDLYLAHRLTLFQGGTATQFFTERRAETAARLQRAEEALGAFEKSHGITNPDEQRNALQKRLSEADSGLDAARLDMQLAETALTQLQKARAAGESDLAVLAVAQYGSALQQELAGQFATAASHLLAARTSLSAQDPAIRKLQASMDGLSQALEAQLAATADQRRRQLELRQSERDAIAAELQTLQNGILRWDELKRDVGSALRAYEFNDNKLNEASGIAALEEARLGNVVVMQSADEKATPVGVRKSSMLLLAAAGGLLLSLTWVVLREFFDHRLKTPDDVSRYLGLRLISVVPPDRRIAGVGHSPAVDAEMARAAAALERVAADEGMRVLVVTAGADDEGVSTVCAQVGFQMACLLGRKVLLVDLGGHRPGLSDHAGKLPRPPARLTLDGARPLNEAIRSGCGGFALADLSGQNGSGGAGPRLDELIAAAESAFDIVMIDAPPWRSGPEALLAIRACSHAMLVVAADSLSWEPLERLCSDLEAERVELVGCVFNRYRRQLPRLLHDMLR